MTEMPKFRKKPVVIEARHWDGSPESAAAIVRWILDNGGLAHYETGIQESRIVVTTLEGEMGGDPGYQFIQGVKGEFYPCKPDIFEQTYEAVE